MPARKTISISYYSGGEGRPYEFVRGNIHLFVGVRSADPENNIHYLSIMGGYNSGGTVKTQGITG